MFMGGSSCTRPQLGYKLREHLQLPRLGSSERKETHQTSCLNTLLFFTVMLQLELPTGGGGVTLMARTIQHNSTKDDIG